MDKVSDVTFALRRRLTAITSQCDLLLEEEYGPLSPEVEQALTQIDDEALEITALLSRLETTHISETPLRDIADPDRPPDIPTGPPESLCILLPDAPIINHLIDEIKQDGYNIEYYTDRSALDVDDIDADSPLVTTPSIGLSILKVKPPVLVSLVTPPAATEPILGISGILSPTADTDVIQTVLDAFHDPAEPTGPIALVSEPTDTENHASIRALLEQLGREVVTIDRDETPAPDVECVLLSTETYTEGRIARLRKIDEGRWRPVILLDSPPNGTDWHPTVGGRTFVQRPVTAPDLAGELLLIIND